MKSVATLAPKMTSESHAVLGYVVNKTGGLAGTTWWTPTPALLVSFIEQCAEEFDYFVGLAIHRVSRMPSPRFS